MVAAGAAVPVAAVTAIVFTAASGAPASTSFWPTMVFNAALPAGVANAVTLASTAAFFAAGTVNSYATVQVSAARFLGVALRRRDFVTVTFTLARSTPKWAATAAFAAEFIWVSVKPVADIEMLPVTLVSVVADVTVAALAAHAETLSEQQNGATCAVATARVIAVPLTVIDTAQVTLSATNGAAKRTDIPNAQLVPEAFPSSVFLGMNFVLSAHGFAVNGTQASLPAEQQPFELIKVDMLLTGILDFPI